VPGWAAYAASKGAVDAFVMNAAKDLGPQGIRICGLRPGMTRTEMLEQIGGDAVVAAGLSTVSLGRAADPQEIAEAAVFLVSPRASYIHGTTIDVTGGR
jgi:NAD(P)-dependent dehydrogenase (short-subunit alcohol dehydrogenase family)